MTNKQERVLRPGVFIPVKAYNLNGETLGLDDVEDSRANDQSVEILTTDSSGSPTVALRLLSAPT